MWTVAGSTKRESHIENPEMKFPFAASVTVHSDQKSASLKSQTFFPEGQYLTQSYKTST